MHHLRRTITTTAATVALLAGILAIHAAGALLEQLLGVSGA